MGVISLKCSQTHKSVRNKMQLWRWNKKRKEKSAQLFFSFHFHFNSSILHSCMTCNTSSYSYLFSFFLSFFLCNQQSRRHQCEKKKREKLQSHDIYRAIDVELFLPYDFICYDLFSLSRLIWGYWRITKDVIIINLHGSLSFVLVRSEMQARAISVYKMITS